MEFLADFHPLVVHFPIVFFLCYTLLEVSGILFIKEELNRITFWFLAAGLLAGIAAVLTGNQSALMSESHFYSQTDFPKNLVEKHEDFASMAIWFYVLITIWRTYLLINKKFKGRIRYIFIIFAFVGAYLIWMTGSVGGDLVYKHGVGTDLTKPLNQDNE